IEILTKDIQDIENLVRNLNNYPTPPIIEIDMAMSKLRNVYELLTMISSDMKADMETNVANGKIGEELAPPTEEHHIPVEETRHEKDGEEQAAAKDLASKDASSKLDEEELARKEASLKLDEEELARKEASLHLAKEEIARKEASIKLAEEEQARKASIVAEKFSASKSINEKISPESNRNISSKLTGEPIDSVKRNIGINDRFLIIRELLNGDNEGYNQLVQQLDACKSFDQAHELIEANFPDKMDHEGVDILVKLSRRKFLSRNA
ncbi:MAG: hypothetical protein WDZ47_08755, partial [Bacteroidales bacterium]